MYGLRVLMLVLGVSVFGSAEARAQKEPITAVIAAQIAAFQQDDFETAFSYASPGIRGIFGTVERFGAMVRGGYPMVWRPAEVRYGALREVAGDLWQRVEVIDQKGRLHFLDYQMKETVEGWKINAVQLLPPMDTTT